jgi:hypothetical protein
VVVLAVPGEPGEVQRRVAVELRARATALGEAVTAVGVVTAAGERGHVGQAPDDRAVESADGPDRERPAPDPVEVDDVRVDRADPRQFPLGEPVDPEAVRAAVEPEREHVDVGAGEAPGAPERGFGAEDRRVVGRLLLDE